MHDLSLTNMLKTARKDAMDEVIALIRSDRVTWPDGMIDMQADDLVEMIQELRDA